MVSGIHWSWNAPPQRISGGLLYAENISNLWKTDKKLVNDVLRRRIGTNFVSCAFVTTQIEKSIYYENVC